MGAAAVVQRAQRELFLVMGVATVARRFRRRPPTSGRLQRLERESDAWQRRGGELEVLLEESEAARLELGQAVEDLRRQVTASAPPLPPPVPPLEWARLASHAAAFFLSHRPPDPDFDALEEVAAVERRVEEAVEVLRRRPIEPHALTPWRARLDAAGADLTDDALHAAPAPEPPPAEREDRPRRRLAVRRAELPEAAPTLAPPRPTVCGEATKAPDPSSNAVALNVPAPAAPPPAARPFLLSAPLDPEELGPEDVDDEDLDEERGVSEALEDEDDSSIDRPGPARLLGPLRQPEPAPPPPAPAPPPRSATRVIAPAPPPRPPKLKGAAAFRAQSAAWLRPEPTREQRRSRRKREVRAHTISVKGMTKRELEIGRMLYPETDYYKPRFRGECVDGPRPCPYVSCQHHLYLDVSARTGAIKLNFPDLEVWEMNETCALDVADRGGETLEEVGAIANLTRERIRQVEVKALALMQEADARAGGPLATYAGEGERRAARRLAVLVADDDDEEDAGAEVADEDREAA